MTQKQGFRKENDLVRALYDRTDDDVDVHPMGASGNHGVPSPDILVRTPVKDHGIELKTRNVDSGDRATFLNESREGDASQLLACRNKYTDVWLAVLFDHRQLMVTRAKFVTNQDEEPVRAFVEDIPEVFDPNVTKSANLTLRKPDTDVWPSSTAGMDPADVLLALLGIPDVHVTEDDDG